MGLGQDALHSMPISSTEAEAKGVTLFSRLVRAKAIPESVMSVRLEKGTASEGVVTQEGGGMYTFGAVEDGYIIGGRLGVTWVNVTSVNYWFVP